MVEYRIDILIDPSGAQSGGKNVERALGEIEDKADLVRKALQQSADTLEALVAPKDLAEGLGAAEVSANSLRDSILAINAEPLAQSLETVATDLQATEATAEELKAAFEGIFSGAGAGEAIASQEALQGSLEKTRQIGLLSEEEMTSLMGVTDQGAVGAVEALGAAAHQTSSQFEEIAGAEAGAAAAINDLAQVHQDLTAVAEKPIELKVDPTHAQHGGKEVEHALEEVEHKAEHLKHTLLHALEFVGVTLSIHALIELAETFEHVQARIRGVTTSSHELTAATEELQAVANETRTDFAATAELFVKLSQSTSNLSRSQQDVIDLTKTLNEVVKISGLTAEQAAGGLANISHAFEFGELKGRQFRTLMKEMPKVIDLLGASLGATRSELQLMAERGELTSKVLLGAFAGAGKGIEESFKALPTTLGQAITVLKNNVLGLVASFDEANGATSAIGRVVLFVAEHIATLGRSIAALTIAVGVKFAAEAVPKMLVALTKLGAAVLANPVTILPALIAGSIGAIIAFGDEISATSDGFATIKDVAIAAFQVIGHAIQPAIDAIADVGKSILGLTGNFDVSFKDILQGTALLVDGVIGLFKGAYSAIVFIWTALPDRFGDIAQLSLKVVRDITESALTTILGSFQALGNIIRTIAQQTFKIVASAGASIKNLASLNIEGAQIAAGQGKEAAELIAATIKSIPEAFSNSINKLANTKLLPEVELTSSAEALGQDVASAFDQGFSSATAATDIVNEIFDKAEERAAERAKHLAEEHVGTESGKESLSVTPETATALSPKDLDLLKSITAAQTEYNATIDSLVNLLDAGKISDEEYAQGLDKASTALIAAAVNTRDLARAREDAERSKGLSSGAKTELAALDTLRGSKLAYDREMQSIEELRQSRSEAEALTINEIADLQDAATVRALDGATSMEAGFTRAFAKMRLEARNFAAVAEQIVNVFASKVEDALFTMAQGGTVHFKDLARSLIQEIEKIIIKLLVLQLIEAATGTAPGGGGGVQTAIVHEGLASGGAVEVGRSYIVGEKGPELFTPSASGAITPAAAPRAATPSGAAAGQGASPAPAAAAPQINLSVVNVQSEDEIPRHLNSGKSDAAILNVLQRNRNAAKKVLS